MIATSFVGGKVCARKMRLINRADALSTEDIDLWEKATVFTL